MSARDKPLPPKHARDHRPVGWKGTTDPGGADPGLALVIQDEGVSLPVRGLTNFTGAGVTASDTGTAIEVLIPGGIDGAFKPQIQWVQVTDTLTGPGGIGATISFASVSNSGYDTLLDLTPAGGTHPIPLVNGWYQATYTVAMGGFSENDTVKITLGNNVLGGGFSPSVSAGTHLGPDGEVVLHVSLPVIHLTTSDFFALEIAASVSGGGTITYIADLIVSLLLPGDP